MQSIFYRRGAMCHFNFKGSYNISLTYIYIKLRKPPEPPQNEKKNKTKKKQQKTKSKPQDKSHSYMCDIRLKVAYAEPSRPIMYAYLEHVTKD